MLRNILGLIASGILILSSCAHTFMGWSAMREELTKAGASADLMNGMFVGWEFGGFAMLALGLIAGNIFLRRQRGLEASTFPALVTGCGYVLFGLWAMLGVEFQPFYFVFIVPGALLTFASWERHQGHACC